MPAMRVLSLLLIAITLLVSAHPARAANVVMEEFMVPSDSAGISLYVRNKHPQRQNTYAPEKIVLFVHGATYPAETTFDLPLGGMSWMDYIAQRGYDVYLVDVRGYGKSTRPPEMDQPASANGPIARTETAARDVGSVVEFIKKRRGVAKLVLMGWSWGTRIVGLYTASHNDNVDKLILYAPGWLYATGATSAAAAQAGSGPLGAYRMASIDSAKTRWYAGAPADQRASLIPPGWFEQWAQATWATDPVGSKMNPPMVRAPNGILADNVDYWQAGKPMYEPSKITVPTMLIQAEWDVDLPLYMDEAYWKLLTATPYKRWVEISGGTHMVLMERNRMQLFREVQLFLDDAYKPE